MNKCFSKTLKKLVQKQICLIVFEITHNLILKNNVTELKARLL